jgi:hypothetical protein
MYVHFLLLLFNDKLEMYILGKFAGHLDNISHFNNFNILRIL